MTTHRDTMYAEINGDVATIVLNRPTVLNCVNQQWVDDLQATLDDIDKRQAVRVIVLRGAGRAFCSGIDLTALSEGAITSRFFSDWELALRRLETTDALVVAAIHSYCIGGGLQLALACDLRIARDDAWLGVTATKEGIIPGMGMWRIARYAGLGRAKRLALAAETIDAGTALAWGLVDYVTDSGSFGRELDMLAQRLLSTPRTSTRLTKKLITMAFDTSFSEFVEVFVEYQGRSLESDEHRRAMGDHRERRAARFRSTPR